MFKDLKALGKESLIYGLSTVAARLLNFLLLPFYTHYLAPADYGVSAALFSYIAFFNILFQHGMDQAYMRHYGERDRSLAAAFYGVAVVSVLFAALMGVFPGQLAEAGGIGVANARLVLYSALILLFDALSAPLFADLRMAHRALRYALLRLLTVAVNVGLNLLLIVHLGRGVSGIFEANVVSSVLAALLVMLPELPRLKPAFDAALYRSMLAFALPLVPAGLGSMAVQVIDRPIMLKLTNEATLGIYQAAYRLGIFMMLIVSMFDQAWRPFFIERASRPEAPGLFARVLTFFAIGASWVTLGLSFFVADVVKYPVFGRSLIFKAYWGGLGLVPVVLWAYVFNGLYINFLAPVIIAKRTARVMGATLLGAAVNVAANLVLIPRFGMLGAAWATFAAYFCMALFMYLAGRGFYHVPYEWGRSLAAIGAGVGLTCCMLFSPSIPAGAWLGIRLVLFLAVFPLFCWSLLDPGEKEALLSVIGRRGPSVPEGAGT
ncbi:MAG: oligosaccharide flippase family protein [Elusimicrobia bacterium]|nr:oligosaccharide flippase family protein [Elusimicrobiota bacterium]